MAALWDAHDIVVEQMPAKDAPASEWAEHYRWAAGYYAEHGYHDHADTCRYRAKLYDTLTAGLPRRT